MKTIYTFTLSSDDVPSSGRINEDDLRLIAYMVYNEIYNYYGEDDKILNSNDRIIYNNLRENFNGYRYRFQSDLVPQKYVYYEPFIISNHTFGFTIVDNNFDIHKVNEIVEYVLNLLRLNYKVKIKCVDYDALNMYDERYRDDALSLIYENFGLKYERKFKFVPMIKNTCSKKRVRAKIRDCYS